LGGCALLIVAHAVDCVLFMEAHTKFWVLLIITQVPAPVAAPDKLANGVSAKADVPNIYLT
jgi:hypothetical protein